MITFNEEYRVYNSKRNDWISSNFDFIQGSVFNMLYYSTIKRFILITVCLFIVLPCHAETIAKSSAKKSVKFPVKELNQVGDNFSGRCGFYVKDLKRL